MEKRWKVIAKAKMISSSTQCVHYAHSHFGNVGYVAQVFSKINMFLKVHVNLKPVCFSTHKADLFASTQI